MARLNKFASVNLNDSYGKPDRGGSANSSNNGAPSGSGKPRISSPGGMLVLSRPSRSQPPSPSSKPGQARLGIPSPVNLPSLKRETSAGEALAASPPIAGWSKGESPPLTGWTKAGESPTDPSLLQQKPAFSRSLDTLGESLKAMSTGKPDVYAPPALRATSLQTGSISRVILPTAPQLEKPSAVIRGEEFPTLQAAAARPPTLPQHPRQKDLQQKQWEKQQVAKEQQLKLQQLSQVQGHKQLQVDTFQSSNGNLQSQPQTLSLRPLGKPERAYPKVNVGAAGPDHPSLQLQYVGLDSNAFPDGSLSWSPPAGVSSQNIVSNKGSNVIRSPPAGSMPSRNISKVDDARDSGHSFRPQYRSPLPASQSSPSVEARQSAFQANSESSWLSSSRRDFVSAPRDVNHTKYAGDGRTNLVEEMGRINLEMRNAFSVKDNYFSKDSPLYQEGNSTGGIFLEDPFMEQGFFARDSSDLRVFKRSSSLVHDSVPRIEGFHSQRSFVREVSNRDAREENINGNRESGTWDNGDSYSRDVRDSRENFVKDSGDIYDRDVKEANSRDCRNVHLRDVRVVYSQDSATSKQMGYGYQSSSNGDSSWRDHASHPEHRYGRGGVSPAGLSSAPNPGSIYDSYYGKQYGSPGMGDHISTRGARGGIDPPKAPLSPLLEPGAPYSSISETHGSRRVRSPGPGSFDSIKEIHEVRSLDRSQSLYEDDKQASYEDKVMDVKVAGSESHGSSLAARRSVTKRESTQGFGSRAFQTNINMKLDDERSMCEDAKKQLVLEDERRKEAAKLKLMELEERIARRAAEVKKEEVEVKGKEASVETTCLKQQDVEQFLSSTHYESEGLASVQDRDGDVPWGEEDSVSKLFRPSSASSSWTYKTPSEGTSSYQEVELRLVGESELHQDRKMVRPRSPSSWRKEVGSGPTSKLFSSPYIESGGFRRPSDGGTYKLF